MAILHEFEQSYKNVRLLEKIKHEHPPEPSPKHTCHWDVRKHNNELLQNSYKLATNSAKCKVVTNCHEIALLFWTTMTFIVLAKKLYKLILLNETYIIPSKETPLSPEILQIIPLGENSIQHMCYFEI